MSMLKGGVDESHLYALQRMVDKHDLDIRTSQFIYILRGEDETWDVIVNGVSLRVRNLVNGRTYATTI